MPGMRQSLPGLFRNTESALRSSTDPYACMMAYSLGQMIDNLRLVAEGKATAEEFFAIYVFDSERRGLADSVRKERYVCMRETADETD